jgi:hypothetical protein
MAAESWLHAFLALDIHENELSASRAGCLISQMSVLRTGQRPGGSYSQSERCVEKETISSLPGIEPRFLSLPA